MKPFTYLFIASICCAALVGCADSIYSNFAVARDQFKSISDQKKMTLAKVLSAKDSEIHDYEAIVARETNVERSNAFPYVGHIRIRYRVSEVDEIAEQDVVTQFYSTDELTAAYQYSADEGNWMYIGSVQSDANEKDTISLDKVLVSFETVLTAFEAR